MILRLVYLIMTILLEIGLANYVKFYEYDRTQILIRQLQCQINSTHQKYMTFSFNFRHHTAI